MARLDHVFETVLGLAGLGLAVNVAFAVLVWLYAVVFVGGSLVSLLVALVFIGLGTVIVIGYLQLYAW